MQNFRYFPADCLNDQQFSALIPSKQNRPAGLVAGLKF
jgi:hypothetical protein